MNFLKFLYLTMPLFYPYFLKELWVDSPFLSVLKKCTISFWSPFLFFLNLKKNYLFIYLVVPGLSCGRQTP